MSYTYDVKIALSKAGYNNCKTLFQQKFPNRKFLLDLADDTYSNPDGILIFSFDSFNHWDTHKDAAFLEDLLTTLNKNGFGYNLIKVGENPEDIFEEFADGSSDSEQFNVIFIETSICMDDNFIKYT